jgi:hypothetical protein
MVLSRGMPSYANAAGGGQFVSEEVIRFFLTRARSCKLPGLSAKFAMPKSSQNE